MIQWLTINEFNEFIKFTNLNHSSFNEFIKSAILIHMSAMWLASSDLMNSLMNLMNSLKNISEN